MSDTLYLQLDQNIQINHPHIYLQDIAKLSCSNSKILNRLRVMPVINLDPDKPGRYVMSVMDLISEIKKKAPDLEINNIGEADFGAESGGDGLCHSLSAAAPSGACLAVVQDYFRRPCRLFRCRFLYHDI